jgi:hypothetical protein
VSKKTYKEYAELPAYVQAVYTEKGLVGNVSPDGADGAKPVWSGKTPPPAVGEKIKVPMNGLGMGDVTGYFTESGFLGVLVKFDSPPEWYVKQNGPNTVGHIFGIEMKSLLEAK